MASRKPGKGNAPKGAVPAEGAAPAMGPVPPAGGKAPAKGGKAPAFPGAAMPFVKGGGRAKKARAKGAK